MGNNPQGYNLNDMTGAQVVAALMKALGGNLPPNGSITVEMLSNGFKITGDKIEDNTITGGNLADECVGEKQIREQNVKGEHIDNHQIQEYHLHPNFKLPNDHLGVGAVGEDNIIGKVVSVPKLADDVVERYENLFNFDTVVVGFNDLRQTITGLDAEGVYSFNLPVKSISSGGFGLGVTQLAENHYTINGADIQDNSVRIDFTTTQDYSNFMFIKGDKLPTHYIPYGHTETINYNLISDVYHNMHHGSCKVSTLLNSGVNFYLQPNRIYDVTLGESAKFYVPILPANEYAQILVQATVTMENSVDWGTTHFFGGNAPEIELGRYNFIWEHDNGVWYAGAVFKEEGEDV